MDVGSAIKIVSALANGVDPHTGEVMQIEGPFQNPDTVRALFLAIKGLEFLESKEKRNNRLPSSAGKAWTTSEDEDLAKEFDTGRTIKELSEKHGRTQGAIQSRLSKLGKIESRLSKLGKIESEDNNTNQFQGNNLQSNPWTAEEDEQMLRDFDAGVPLRELSSKYGRNMGAIQTRLLTLGRKIF